MSDQEEGGEKDKHAMNSTIPFYQEISENYSNWPGGAVYNFQCRIMSKYNKGRVKE